MQQVVPPEPSSPPGPSHAPPPRQRWLLAAPDISLALFILAIGAFLWGLHVHDVDQRRSSLIEDILWEDQTIRLHFQGTQDALALLARELSEENLTATAFQARASLHVRNNPELNNIAWIDADGVVRWTAPHATTGRLVGAKLEAGPSRDAFRQAQLMGRAAYSPPVHNIEGDARIEVHVPVYREGSFRGTIAGFYSVSGILRHLVPWWFAQKYQLSIVDSDGGIVASKLDINADDPDLTYQINFDPPGHGLGLKATSYGADPRAAQNMLAALIVGLSALIIWSLWAVRRHMRQRLKAEEALRTEHAFRMAMEDSVLAGLRAIDLEGRITYVNQAFCTMVGWSAEELVGCTPPMPYWAPEDREPAEAAYNATLAGIAPTTGFELRFRRKNGERFDALLFISPLIDAKGRQTGWMASMNDITERKRAREELRESHERFVAVLDGLDAAVSVTDTETHELLYVNEHFRRVFGLDSEGERRCHITHAWQAHSASTENTVFDAEIRDPASDRWYHVRSRSIRWVDGRMVHMEVATDITEHKRADELARQQQEKLQFTSRLITMGEMASSLAHELNQPLSAIASYNTGCVNRLQADAYSRDELLGALEKIGTQARRAGKIINRIREFVRRREPDRVRCSLAETIEEVAGFAEIEARKWKVAIETRLDRDLPPLHADRIMLEQVLLNLLNNAIEAMHDTPAARRRVIISAVAGDDTVEVTVRDHGPGIEPEAADKLFKAFYTTKQEGMGMGLNICRSIIEFHRGRLWVEPADGGGSAFRFTLPLE